MSRQNKANKRNNRPIQDVAVVSPLMPFKADNILNFSARYQNTNTSIYFANILRSYLLSTILVGNGASIGYRVCSAVRVNRVRIYTAITASLEWVSQYGPTSATIVQGTSTSTSGVLHQKPAKNSLASFWSMSGSNEGDSLMLVGLSPNDVIDVDFSVVLMDNESPVSTTISGGAAGQVYRTFLDGPSSGQKIKPLYNTSI